MTTAAPPSAVDAKADAQPGPGGESGSRALRRWRAPLVLAVVIFLGGIFIALASPSTSTPANTYLDPTRTGPAGSRALADILAGRGTEVVPVRTAAAAKAAADRGASTLVITSPSLLTGAELRLLASAPADLVIVAPDPVSAAALAPGIEVEASTFVGPIQPHCRLAAATLAGNADLGDVGMRLRAGLRGSSCYPLAGLATLVQYAAGARQITVLGTGAPLENQNLAQLGNAALALNLLSGRGQLVWLTPQPPVTAAAGPTGGPASIWSLIPLAAYLVAIQLGVALLLIAAWRARRLGPLSTERLPVVVRASETTEGHARLYQARRARGRAAAELRDATIGRLSPAVGLPAGATAEAITAAIAARSSRSAQQLHQLLFGSPPASDGALIRLAEELDAMEREVRAQ
jgi:Domain of unknown function (DUF4350)